MFVPHADRKSEHTPTLIIKKIVESKYHGAKNEEKILSLKLRGKIIVLYLTRIPGAPELLG